MFFVQWVRKYKESFVYTAQVKWGLSESGHVSLRNYFLLSVICASSRQPWKYQERRLLRRSKKKPFPIWLLTATGRKDDLFLGDITVSAIIMFIEIFFSSFFVSAVRLFIYITRIRQYFFLSGGYDQIGQLPDLWFLPDFRMESAEHNTEKEKPYNENPLSIWSTAQMKFGDQKCYKD